MTERTLPFFERLALAFRVLFDGPFAREVAERAAAPRLPAAPAPEEPVAPEPALAPTSAPRISPGPHGALSLLALLQREGRLVDFLQQDVAAFPDAEIGAAARVVHSGCRKALLSHVEMDRIRSEAEGSTITVAEGFDGAAIKLIGDVRGAPPYRGVLRHSGWRALKVTLPESTQGHDPHVLAPAEVEL